MTQEAKKLAIFMPVSVPAPSEVRGADTRALPEAAARVVHVSVEQVQANMSKFLEGLQAILAKGAAIGGAFQVDTVEVNTEISGSGEIGFLGSGLGLSGTAGIKLVLKRQGD